MNYELTHNPHPHLSSAIYGYFLDCSDCCFKVIRKLFISFASVLQKYVCIKKYYDDVRQVHKKAHRK